MSWLLFCAAVTLQLATPLPFTLGSSNTSSNQNGSSNVASGWQGPFNQFYSDEDCPNLGCYGKSEDWPFWIPAGTKPTVEVHTTQPTAVTRPLCACQICQKMCDYCDGTNPGPHSEFVSTTTTTVLTRCHFSGHCPHGCNAFNGGDGGCCLRLCDNSKILSPSGGPGTSYHRVDPPPSPAPPGGHCANLPKLWGPPSACIGGNGHWNYHCPWESAGLVSTQKFGGCNAIKYDCVSTDVPALVQLYDAHSTPQSPPPEWGIPSIQYAECCVKHQCLSGPACGVPPRPD